MKTPIKTLIFLPHYIVVRKNSISAIFKSNYGRLSVSMTNRIIAKLKEA